MVIKCEDCRWWSKPKHKALNGRCTGPIALWCESDIYTSKDFYCKYGERKVNLRELSRARRDILAKLDALERESEE